MILCFEGINGTGKSTQIKLLCAELIQRNIPHVVFFDPGVSADDPAQQLRKLFLQGNDLWRDVRTSLLIGSAARCELTTAIRTALSENSRMLVILDRYQLSTFAYQTLMLEAAGISGHHARQAIEWLGSFIRCVQIDELVFLDTPAAVAYHRRGGSRREVDAQKDDQFEARGLAFAEQLRNRYRTLVLEERPVAIARLMRHVPIDEHDSPEKVYAAWRSTTEALNSFLS